jgi:hypothetical protein
MLSEIFVRNLPFGVRVSLINRPTPRKKFPKFGGIQKLNHLVKEVKWSQSPMSIKDSMEGGNKQSKRIRHPLADVSLEHAERFENMGPISGPAYGSVSMGSYEAATVEHWLYMICEPRFIVVYDEQSLVNEDQDGNQLQPVHVFASRQPSSTDRDT